MIYKFNVNYLLVMIVFFLNQSCSKKSDLDDLNLKGNIASITSTKYNAVERFGKPETTSRAKRNDFLKEEVEENSKFVFSSEKKLNEIILYDQQGQTLQVLKTINDSVVEIYSDTGALLSRLITENTDYPKFINTYDFEGKLLMKIENNYNLENLVSEELEYNAEGALSTKIENKYNDKNQLLSKKYTLSDPYERIKNIELGFDYDADNFVKILKYIYNGDIIRVDYKYEKDKIGNWIKRIEFINNKIAHIVQREIIYY